MAKPPYRLVIGNKNWSSWSLRPWLALAQMGLPFEEVHVQLRQPETKAEILKLSPSGLVPLLLDGDFQVWDSLAILEYLAERHTECGLWPEDAKARARARSVAAEMHSGFVNLRRACPMEVLAINDLDPVPDEVAADVVRIVGIWRDCRAHYGSEGPFLFGRFTAADAMYAPVASRFRTYFSDLSPYGDDGTASTYVEAIFSMPEMQRWISGAREQTAASALAG